jgi:hypothetical protein
MRRSLLLLAGAAAMAISLTVLKPAQAEYGWHLTNVDYFDDEGDWVEFWEDGEGHRLIFVIEDGETIGFIADGFDNPNPLEGSGSDEDTDHLIDLAKKRGARIERITNLAGTPLGHLLLQGGNLIDPVHNPSDVGYEDTDGLGGGGGGFTPGNGSPTEQLKKHAGKGNKSKGDGEDGDDLKSTEVGLFDDNMPGPPELVNPNPQRTLVGRDGFGRGANDGNGGGAGGGGGAGNASR